MNNRLIRTAMQNQHGRRIRVVLVGFLAALFISACGGGSADEPASPGSRVVTGSVPVTAGADTASHAPDKIGVSAPSDTTATNTQNDFSSAGECDLNYLNSTRFLSSGLVATGIDDSLQCGFCPSAEICTTPDGECHCVVVKTVN